MKTIPIVAAETGCEEPSGEVPKLDLPLTRRDMLRGSGILMGTLTVGTTLATLAPSTVWAVELKTLSQAEGEAIMAMGRVLFPHAKLPDAVYALLAKDLDGAASGDAGKAKMMREGVAALNKAAGGNFAKAGADVKAKVVKDMAGQPFFAAVRGQCITSLYDNDMAYSTFGYPGSSWDKGGYITRGFQDLKWLPDPPATASPPPFMG